EGLPLYKRRRAGEAKHSIGLDLAACGVVGGLIPKTHAQGIELKLALPAAWPAGLAFIGNLLHRNHGLPKQFPFLADFTGEPETEIPVKRSRLQVEPLCAI